MRSGVALWPSPSELFAAPCCQAIERPRSASWLGAPMRALFTAPSVEFGKRPAVRTKPGSALSKLKHRPASAAAPDSFITNTFSIGATLFASHLRKPNAPPLFSHTFAAPLPL